jgi:predicted nuclease of predicted toxin-antitoxin system
MKFIADMGVSQRVAAWLRSRGHDVAHLRDEGLHRLPNGQIFEMARARGSVILTFDLDFGEIIALSGESTVSVILFRLNNTTSPFVIERLQSVLDSAAVALQSGAIVVVEDARHRVRRLPLGS